jgi:uncharacterized iron-regulated membrane protein
MPFRTMATPRAPSPMTAPPKPLSDAYRAVWRWHFYAGLLVMPFLMLLALTGGLYLFKDEIDQAVYRPMIQIPSSQAHAAPEAWVAAAEKICGGRAASILMPEHTSQAVRIRIDRDDGDRRTVFVDPHTARVTGVTAYGGVMETIKRLHSLSLFGTAMNLIIEVVAGWTIILVTTGIFLWWPRKRPVGIVSIRATEPARRPFWRDLHAVTGLYAGGVVLFLAVTGMPWSAVWGEQVMGALKTTGLGRPPAPVAGAWQRAEHQDHPTGAGWTMEGMVMPASPSDAARLGRVIASAESRGLPRPYAVSIPLDEALAYTVTAQARRVEDSRSLYVDGASGAVLADIGYSQFGAGAKAVEWGIYVHQGTQFGWTNRILMLGGCIAVWLLAISGFIMWWKRRPKGRLAPPAVPPGPRVRAAILGIVLPLAILYPLTGLSLILALLLDRAVRAMRRPTSAAF